MTVLDVYDKAALNQEIESDPIQRQLLSYFQRLADELVMTKSAWLPKIFHQPVKGIYLQGPVGAGKTYLMDLFYQTVDYPRKARFHFHYFMQQIDAQLRQIQGEKNPLQKIAADFAKSTKLLCFDEFFVHDVAYAMILADLLKALFKEGVVLVITSNTRPDDLYLNGVQRQRFLPAIELIKSHCECLYLNERRDYRLGRTAALDAYLYPLNTETEQKFEQQFSRLASEAEGPGMLVVQNRPVPYIKCSNDLIWFDFQVLCNMPRSQLDYLEIAERFTSIFVSNIPALTEKNTIQAILLMHFVDVIYDRGIRLIISAAVPINELYRQGEVSREFQRTLSRLQEMQSEDYLHRHRFY